MNQPRISARLVARPYLLNAFRLLVFSCLAIGVARADTITGTGWKGTAGNNNWSSTGNWDAAAPNTSGTGDRNLFFGQGYANAGGTGSTTANNDLSSWHGYRMTFQDIGSDASGANDKSFTITGNSFTVFDFGGNFPRIENDSYLTQTFTLTSGQTLGLDGFNAGQKVEIDPVNGNIVFSAGTKIDLPTTNQLQVYGNNGNSVTFNGPISSSGNNNGNSVAINQNSTVIFAATNTYGGDTFVNAGTLRCATNSAVTNTTFIRLGDTAVTAFGANLNLDGGLVEAAKINVRFGSTGSRIIANTASTTGTATFSGNLFLDTNVTLFANSGGGVTLSGTTLDLKNQTLTVDGTGTNIISGVLTNSTGTGKLIKNGTGMLTLSGANTNSGGVTLNAGTLNINSAAALGSNATFTVTGGTIDNTTASAITLINYPQAWNGDFAFTGTKDLNLGPGAVTLGASRQVTVNGGTLTVGGVIGGGALTLTKAGAGALTLSGASTYSGGTTVRAGSLYWTANNSLGFGNITINDASTGVSAASLLCSGTVALTLTNDIVVANQGSGTVTIGSDSGSGTANFDWSGGITLNRSISLKGNSISTGNGTRFNGVISGAGGITKIGGTLASLTIANTYAGDTAVSTGTLRGTVDNAFPSGAGKGNVSVASGATLELANINQKFNGLSGLGTLSKTGSNTKTLTLGDNDATSQFDGVISMTGGSSAVTKLGAGTLTLTGGNSWPSGTAIQNGAIQISGGNDRLPTTTTVTLGAASTSGKLILGDGTAARNQTLVGLASTGLGGNVVGGNSSVSILTTTGTTSYGGILGGAGANENNLALNVSSGTLTLSGNNTYTGGTTINTGGTISIGSSVVTPFGDTTLSTINLAGGTLTTSASRTASSAPVGNPINLTADSVIQTTSTGAAVDLNFTNTSIGGSAGTLTFNNAAASGTGVFQPRLSSGFTFGRPIVIANGSFGTTLLQSFNTSGNDQTFNGVISGSGSYKRTATSGGTGGNTIFTAANTYSGGTTLNDGGIGFGIDSVGSPVTSGPVGTGTLTIGANNNVRVFASGGAHAVGNAIVFNSSPLIISGANNLTLSGNIDLGSSGRTIQVDNSGASILSGVISSSGGGLTKTGSGGLTLSGTNSYSGTTLLSAGTLFVNGSLGTNSVTANSTLSGTGTINGATTVNFGGTLQAGLGGNNTSALAISNSLALAGNAQFNLNRTNVQTVNKVTGLTTVTYGGTLTVTNVGSSLTNGDTFVLFSAAAYAGGFTNIILPALDPSLLWNTNNLALNGSISVVLAISPSSLALASSSNPSGYLDTLTFTATVTPTNATGSVTFFNGATPFSTNSLVAGVAASAGINTLPRGTNTITAIYGGDINYLLSSNSLAQIVTNHPPVANNVGYYRGAVNSFKFQLSELLTNASDTDVDTITLASFSTSTNGITLSTNGSWIMYSNPSLVNDQFTYTVSDGFGGSATATITLTAQAFLTGQNATVSVGGSTATVNFAGIPGYSYSVQRSTNMVDWVGIRTTNAPSGGVFNVTDDFSDLGVVPGSAYYRLQYNP